MVRIYLSHQGSSLELLPGETVVGRDPTCRVRLRAPFVSRRHARLEVEGDTVRVTDLESRNGTFVNGIQVAGEAWLRAGDEMTFGGPDLALVLEAGGEDFEPITEVSSSPEDPGASPITQEIRRLSSPDRRRHARLALEVPVVYESEDLQVEATSLNLSWSGVFIQTPILDEVGTSCRLTMRSDDRGSFTLSGRVRRVVDVPSASEPLGLGIEFADLEQSARRWLEGALGQAPGHQPMR